MQSLDDTPGKFKSSQTKNVPLRFNLKSYLQKFYELDGLPASYAPSYSRDGIGSLIPPEELMYFRCFDISFVSKSEYIGKERESLKLCFVLCNSRVRADMVESAYRVGRSEGEEFEKWLIQAHPSISKSGSLNSTKFESIKREGLASYQKFALQHLSDSVSPFTVVLAMFRG